MWFLVAIISQLITTLWLSSFNWNMYSSWRYLMIEGCLWWKLTTQCWLSSWGSWIATSWIAKYNCQVLNCVEHMPSLCYVYIWIILPVLCCVRYGAYFVCLLLDPLHCCGGFELNWVTYMYRPIRELIPFWGSEHDSKYGPRLIQIIFTSF